jgi:hypothetical protein
LTKRLSGIGKHPDGKEMIDYSLKQEDPDFDVKALKSEKIFVNQASIRRQWQGKKQVVQNM